MLPTQSRDPVIRILKTICIRAAARWLARDVRTGRPQAHLPDRARQAQQAAAGRVLPQPLAHQPGVSLA
jgi:hypothetical protein